jgi:transposase InsO family protein
LSATSASRRLAHRLLEGLHAVNTDQSLPSEGRGQPVHQHRLHRHARGGGRQMSMDGRGRWIDNVFIEPLWRSVKYENIYLPQGIRRSSRDQSRDHPVDTFYNERRPHQALANRTPMATWRDGVTGTFGEGTVEMTLRLDSVGALPTSPQ